MTYMHISEFSEKIRGVIIQHAELKGGVLCMEGVRDGRVFDIIMEPIPDYCCSTWLEDTEDFHRLEGRELLGCDYESYVLEDSPAHVRRMELFTFDTDNGIFEVQMRNTTYGFNYMGSLGLTVSDRDMG